MYAILEMVEPQTMRPEERDIHVLVNVECIRLLGEVVRPDNPPRLRFRILRVPERHSSGVTNTNMQQRKRDSLIFLLVLRRCTRFESVGLLLAFLRSLPLLLNIAFCQFRHVNSLPGLSEPSQLDQI